MNQLGGLIRLQRRTLDQPALVLLDQMIVSGSNFLAVMLVGRALPQQEFGLFALAYASVLFIANLHRAFVTQPLNVLGADEGPRARASRLRGLMRAHGYLLPPAWLGIALAGLFFFRDPWLVLAACLYAAALLMQDLQRRYWYTLGDVPVVLRNDALSFGGQVLAVLLATRLVGPYAAVALAAMALAPALGFLRGRRYLPPASIRMAPLRPLLAEHLRFAGWLLATVFATWAGSQLYPFLLAGLGATSVAMFAASRNLLSAVSVIVQAVNNYLPTRLRRLLAEHDVGGFSAASFRTAVHIGLLAGALVLVCALFARPLLNWTYGPAYADSAHVLVVLGLGAFFMAQGSVVGAMALALGDNRSSFLANAAAGVFTFTLGARLINVEGLTGAAVASSTSLAIAVLVQTALLAYRVRRVAADEPAVPR